ncbi:hypothetical protein BDP81DRAFT_502941 [Colletotrichum phormii]|uniref:Uncharacterized protein n=1 Tax=Colletotrichum phormii TaxID=359342 RepID=A0AAI9ZGJ0_9PEZI|nr:uncharacterized protein BDP81DRAFT_502941 [Colletotrichum phormii]KAK1623842.1 hypothetical protein BDP81DRAFT_502941 [Colletotrichum phormii]
MEDKAKGYDKYQSMLDQAQFYQNDRSHEQDPHGVAPETFSEFSAPSLVSSFDMEDMNDALPRDLEDSEMTDSGTEAISRMIQLKNASLAEEMLGHLAYKSDAVQKVADELFQLHTNLSKNQKETLHMIKGTDKYTSFTDIKLKATCRLLINAREGQNNSVATTSYLAATIMNKQAYKEDTSTFIIGWFCAHNAGLRIQRDGSDPVECLSRGMMASLLCQLVHWMVYREIDCDLSFISGPDWDDIKQFELVVLSKAFTRLVAQLPEGSQIICFIDEIRHYEKKDTDDAYRAIKELVALTNRVGPLKGPRYFKLLLTCNDKALGIKNIFEGKSQSMEFPQEA